MDIIEILSEKATESSCRIWVSPKHNYSKGTSLNKENMMCAFEDAIEEAKYLDCIWFEGNRNVPAIFKICEENNYEEALYRLITFKETYPDYLTSYFLIANDYLEPQISSELAKPLFHNFNIKIIPTSKIKKFTHTFKVLG